MLALSVVLEILGVATAIAAFVLGWPYPVLVAAVVVFLIAGHFTRRQLRRRGQAPERPHE